MTRLTKTEQANEDAMFVRLEKAAGRPGFGERLQFEWRTVASVREAFTSPAGFERWVVNELRHRGVTL